MAKDNQKATKAELEAAKAAAAKLIKVIDTIVWSD